jgi:hypothetical protein
MMRFRVGLLPDERASGSPPLNIAKNKQRLLNKHEK